MLSFNHIRFKFLYVCCASALVSALCTLFAYKSAEVACKLVLQRSPHQIRPVRWLIEHIGGTPVALALGGMIFVALFYWRSGKIKDDIMASIEGERR
ncbi:hypothetical protein GXP70_25555 [Paenibacillus lycopersici]|uniref:Uncharacterized protein n=1 Tax=Paenibacillus lycopersici TaxID=2704462 RepID=A0A6C0G5N8_9BACL|nr:hypothetical protein [Paenibacillus lycopersici]QHT62999.1 hypothetical protein GXP70_25555 [Paenibacillus lycopersici]